MTPTIDPIGQVERPLPGAPEPAPLSDAVRDALGESGLTWLRRVEVVAEGRRVVLRGTVPSYYLKQLAQVRAMAVPGVEAVRNELAVPLSCGPRV